MFRIESTHFDYFRDVYGQKQGEYKEYHVCSLELEIHCFYKNDQYHGEYKEFNRKGKLLRNYLYINGEQQLIDISNISPEEKLAMSIKYNVRFIK